jgi:hypothetical protein
MLMHEEDLAAIDMTIRSVVHETLKLAMLGRTLRARDNIVAGARGLVSYA